MNLSAGTDSALKVALALSILCLQAGQPVFRASVNFVELDVSVLDRARRPVTGLTVADFTVLEDGVPQKIEVFDAVTLGQAPPQPKTMSMLVPSDVQENRGLEAGRVLTLVVQEGAHPLHRVKAIARAIVQEMRAADRMAVIDLSLSGATLDFTGDRARLLEAIDRLRGVGVSNLNRGDMVDPGNDLRMPALTMCGTVPFTETALPFIENLTAITRQIAAVQGRRKALFLIGDHLPGLSGECIDPWLELYAEAQRAHLLVYPVNPRGLESSDDVTITSVDEAARWRSVHRDQTSVQRSLAENTGGIAITETNMFAENLEQVFAENRAYYILGYHSTNTSTDRRFRKISVSVARDDMTVRTRSGYVAPNTVGERTDEPRPPVVDALDTATRALVPATALLLEATALLFRTAAGLAVAVVAVPWPNLDTTSPTRDQVQVRATLVDAHGDIKGTAERRVAATLSNSRQNAQLRVPLFLAIPKAGHYQVRVAAHSAATNATGSVFVNVDVPDLARERLSMSGVAWQVVPDSPSMRLPELDGVFTFIPSTRRAFRASDQVEASVRLYANRLDSPVVVTCRILGADGVIVDTRQRVLQPEDARGVTGALLRCPVDVPKRSAGQYLFEIGARAGSHAAARKSRFSIE